MIYKKNKIIQFCKNISLILIYSWGLWGFQTFAQEKPLIIVIDAGHGGADPGKPHSDPNLHHEKALNLEIALKTGEQIEKNIENVKVLYTRSEDKYMGLSDRVDFANSHKADLLISIHCNSSPSAAVMGSEVHIHSRKLTTSNKLAAIIGAELQKVTEKRFRGIVDAKQRNRNLYMTQYADMPSVLVEVGYMTNPSEEKYLNSEAGQDKIAQALMQACQKFIDLHLPKDEKKTLSPIYRVQILASANIIPLESKVFEKLEEKVDIFELNGNEKYRYKYLIGREFEAQRAEELAKKVEKLGFKGAFVVQIEVEEN
jgi:N-acetylmuramoyl-L-alanine amidase